MVDAVEVHRYDCPRCPYCVYASMPVQCPHCENVEASAMDDAGRVGVTGTEVDD